MKPDQKEGHYTSLQPYVEGPQAHRAQMVYNREEGVQADKKHQANKPGLTYTGKTEWIALNTQIMFLNQGQMVLDAPLYSVLTNLNSEIL